MRLLFLLSTGLPHPNPLPEGAGISEIVSYEGYTHAIQLEQVVGLK